MIPKINSTSVKTLGLLPEAYAPFDPLVDSENTKK